MRQMRRIVLCVQMLLLFKELDTCLMDHCPMGLRDSAAACVCNRRDSLQADVSSTQKDIDVLAILCFLS